MVRAKFRCWSVIPSSDGAFNIELHAVTEDSSEENKTFWKYTPAGSVTLSTVNKAAADYYEPGVEYYLDFTKAE